jgi:hypothetical protein
MLLVRGNGGSSGQAAIIEATSGREGSARTLTCGGDAEEGAIEYLRNRGLGLSPRRPKQFGSFGRQIFTSNRSQPSDLAVKHA